MWIKCSERLPPYSVTVLGAIRGCKDRNPPLYVKAMYRWKTDSRGEHWYESKDGVMGEGSKYSVEYWMPLPEPPEKTPASQDKGTP